LHEEGGFADAGLAGEERDRTEENATAEDGVEIGEAGLEALFFGRNFEVVDGSVFENFAGDLTAGDGGFFFALRFGALFEK